MDLCRTISSALTTFLLFVIAILVCVKAAARPQYEYCSRYAATCQTMIDTAKQLGVEGGWEIMAIERVGQYDKVVYFKRQK